MNFSRRHFLLAGGGLAAVSMLGANASEAFEPAGVLFLVSHGLAGSDLAKSLRREGQAGRWIEHPVALFTGRGFADLHATLATGRGYRLVGLLTDADELVIDRLVSKTTTRRIEAAGRSPILLTAQL